MLKKLLKHEFRDTARIIPLLYLICLIFAGMELSAKTLGVEWFRVTASVVLLVLGIAVSVTTFVVLVMRFHKNLYSSEGYLMFTLPVKPYLLLAAKNIAALFWMLSSYCITAGAILISLDGLGFSGELIMIADELKRYGLEKTVFLIIPLIILATLYLLTQIYFAVTVSNRTALHSMGLGAAFLVFIATNVILQIVEFIFAIFVPFSVQINLKGSISASFISESMLGYVLSNIKGAQAANPVIGLGGYVFEVIMLCILFYATSEMMKNKVSLK